MVFIPPTSSLQLVIPEFLLEHDKEVTYAPPPKYRDNSNILDVQAMNAINVLAEPQRQCSAEKQAQQKKKEELHEQSVKRYKQWNNTVLGERRKKIEAARDKELVLEQQREKIDAAWAIVKKEEHRLALDRAAHLKYNGDPRVRELNSKLLMMKVIEEREKQAEYKQRRKEFKRAQEQSEREDKSMDSFIALMDKGNQWQQSRMQSLDVVRDQKQQIQKAAKAKLEAKQRENEMERLEVEKQVLEVARLKTEALKKKHKQTEQFQNTLMMTIKEKEAFQKKAKEEEKQLINDNHAFNNYKIQMENSKKAVEAENLKKKQGVSEITSKIQQEMNQKTQFRVEDYLKKLEACTAFNLDISEKKANLKRAAGLLEQNRYREFKIQEKKRENEEKAKAIELERIYLDSEKEADARDRLNKLTQSKNKVLELASFRNEQKIAFHGKRDKEKQESMAYNTNLQESLEKDSKVFEEYLDIKCKELGLESKKNLILQDLKTFQKEKKKISKFPWEAQNDSFSRLGFITQ